MADTIFQIGEVASRAKFVAGLEDLRSQGKTVLDSLSNSESETLLNFERRLSAVNARGARAKRVLAPGTAALFLASDFSDIDQAQTTATVRIDAQTATLRERSDPAAATVRSMQFTASAGTIESLDTKSTMFRVTTPGTAPAGVFAIELTAPLRLSLLVFDIAAMASSPEVIVEVSQTGVTFTKAVSVSLSGYRITAWLTPVEVRYIRVTITPSHPDNLSGSSYTFGLTGFTANGIDFHLRSELVGRPITIPVLTGHLSLTAPSDPNITYFLSLAGQPLAEVVPDQELDVPGIAQVNSQGVALNGTGVLQHALDPAILFETLVITDLGSGIVVPLAPGLDAADPNAANMTTQVIAISGSTLTLLPYSAADATRTFSVDYTTGPNTVTAQLKVQLSTSDMAQTPVFRGASLEQL